MRSASWVALVALAALGGFVVYSSLTTAHVHCEVCVEFRGREACRAVEAATEDEALAGARTNACALVAAGVTDSMACARTPPSRTECRTR